MNILYKNNISIIGSGRKAMMFAHSYGSDQNVWRFITPAFEDEFKIILFDHVGAGRSDTISYDEEKYDTLQGYADDVLDICKALKLENVTFVGHAAGCMIGALASIKKPSAFEKLIMISPSTYHIDMNGYKGGFSNKEMQTMLKELDSNYIDWSRKLVPKLLPKEADKDLVGEVIDSYAKTDPEIARHFIRVALLSDNRKNLKKIKPETLVIQNRNDIMAPMDAGEYIQFNIPDSEMVILDSSGHYTNLSAPNEIISAMRIFL